VSHTSRGFRRLSTVLVAISPCALVAAAIFHTDRNVIASRATGYASSNAPAAKAGDAKPEAAASQAAFSAGLQSPDFAAMSKLPSKRRRTVAGR
jgi:hypothetical protein